MSLILVIRQYSETLRNLENVGLVEHVPHKGVRVVDFTVEDVEEFYLLRSLLKCFAVREAIARLDDEALENLTKFEDQMFTDLIAHIRSGSGIHYSE